LNSNTGLTEYPDLDPSKIPHHVAIIMDGNGRWAKKRLMNRVKGHERGMEAVRTIVRTSRKIGVSILTLYAFSTENWQRPRAEIAALMALLNRFCKTEKDEILDNNIRLEVIGQFERLPADNQKKLQHLMDLSGGNTGMVLNLALSYGGRAEIVRMVREIARKAGEGRIDPYDITSETVADHLYTKGKKDPDLMIRTSGEMRISNFLLWQLAYSELFVTDTLWPDFGKEEYIDIIRQFQKRERRFGKVP